jgi:protein-tyrosine phosphatase
VRQVLPYWLWLGHAGDGRHYTAILDAGIRAVVQLALEEPALQPPRYLLYIRLPLLDGAGNRDDTLLLAVRTVADLVRRRVPTLVCCGGGMSRAPAVAAAALALVEQAPPEECLRRLAEQQHPTDVTPGLWNEIVEQLLTESPDGGPLG